mgnify:CR=1 FL=1
MNNILVLNGPNLNLLGLRETSIYGYKTLSDINNTLIQIGLQHNINIVCFQSNNESSLIDKLHEVVYHNTINSNIENQYSWIIINPAAYTHTSIALMDALAATNLPFIEVHISNIHAREQFRQHSYFSKYAKAVITGCGTYGYELALNFIINNNQENI